MKRFVFNCLVFLLSSFLFIACTGVNRSSGPGSPGLIKIFTKGQDSLLCHAGPVNLVADGNKDELKMDYTYLKVKNASNPVSCNFSLITTDESFRPHDVVVEVDGVKFPFDKIQKFYAEGFGKKEYIHRYSFQISDSLFYNWMTSANAAFYVNDRKFSCGKKFRKDANEIYRKILFDLR